MTNDPPERERGLRSRNLALGLVVLAVVLGMLGFSYLARPAMTSALFEPRGGSMPAYH